MAGGKCAMAAVPKKGEARSVSAAAAGIMNTWPGDKGVVRLILKGDGKRGLVAFLQENGVPRGFPNIVSKMRKISPLMAAIVMDDPELVEFLLSGGDVGDFWPRTKPAEVDAAWKGGTEGGITALIRACRISEERPNAPAIVRMLLEHGANIEARSGAYAFQRTPLLSAVRKGMWGQTDLIWRAEITKILLAKGADANAQDSDGNTALMGAALNKDEPIARLLLEANANPFIRNKQGKTAEDLWPGEMTRIIRSVEAEARRVEAEALTTGWRDEDEANARNAAGRSRGTNLGDLPGETIAHILSFYHNK